MYDDCRRHGNPPLSAVVVHGGPGAPGSAFALAAGLSHEVGAIEPFQTETTVSSQVDELHRQISEYSDTPVWLFGHSWGAWLSSLYASEYPQNVRKLFLIGSGPLEDHYVCELSKRRMNRLDKAEQIEFHQLIDELHADGVERKDDLLRRLGELTSKSDSYDIEDFPDDKSAPIEVDGAQFANVWDEAAGLRTNGGLLKKVVSLCLPIVVIHGRDDPHPVEGIIEPLRREAREVTSYILERCGHYPWKEKYASERFWEIVHAELNVKCADRR